MNAAELPALNAALNGLATALMSGGFVFLRAARRATSEGARSANLRRHRTSMLLAAAISGIFLASYVTHKILVRGVHTPFGGTGAIAVLYYVILLSHIVLAMAIAYLVPRTLFLAWRGDHERHRRWARWTLPIWLYVSVTGVLVYFFLYRWWPAVPRSG